MNTAAESLPPDLAPAHAMILAERHARVAAEANANNAQPDLSSSGALIAHLKLAIEKLSGRCVSGIYHPYFTDFSVSLAGKIVRGCKPVAPLAL